MNAIKTAAATCMHARACYLDRGSLAFFFCFFFFLPLAMLTCLPTNLPLYRPHGQLTKHYIHQSIHPSIHPSIHGRLRHHLRT
ncbi:uncharacterized protein IWZ02DRAFT_444212 [Phyllosticta citriasiana]|uniref:uncharacterized protein n=1 Tax=Phyllosticta citriasiana TaxID=595635 RepID=UPI0030FDE013